MTRGLLWFLLLNNACVLGLCTFYFIQGDVLYWAEGSIVPRLRFDGNLTSRAIGLIPFVFSFGYLVYMLKHTVEHSEDLKALDAPLSAELPVEDQ